jgi:hypothetical protein
MSSVSSKTKNERNRSHRKPETKILNSLSPAEAVAWRIYMRVPPLITLDDLIAGGTPV